MNLCQVRVTGYGLLCNECFKVNMHACMHMYARIKMTVMCRVYLQICRFLTLKNLLHDAYTIFPFLRHLFCLLVTVFLHLLVFPETIYISAQLPHLHTVFSFDFCFTKRVWTSWRGSMERPQI